MPQRSNRFWLVAFITAWAVDFLFFGHAVGVSLFIWLGLLLAGGLWLACGEGHRPAALSWLLMGLILVTGAIAFVRAEPFSQAIGVLVSLAGLLLLAATFRNGHWPFYRTLDIIREILGVVGAALVRPAGLFKPREATAEPVQAGQQTFWKSAAPVLRGILLAIPVVAVLGLLLSSADLVFPSFVWCTS